MFLWTVTCCGTAPQKPTSASSHLAEQQSNQPSITADVSSSVGNRPPEVRQSLAPSYTGKGPPRVFIHNSYLTTQYVFLDSQSIAVVPPAAERSFEIPEGAHSITVSDTANGQRNLQHIAEVFDAGFEYRYDIVAR
jgi:hypothetical protein